MNLPLQELLKLDPIRIATLPDLTRVHYTAVAQLFGHKLVDEHILLAGTRLNTANKVRLALVDFLHELV